MNKVRCIEYDKELFEHICHKDTTQFSSDVDKGWYSKSKIWLLGKQSNSDKDSVGGSCSSSSDGDQKNQTRYSPTTLDKHRGPDFKPYPDWTQDKKAVARYAFWP